MTRLGVLADVHGNLAALEAVLAALDAARVDGLVCAGDLVGYGPEPDACVARVVASGATTVAGNHDLIAIGRLGTERCDALARETLAWTAQAIAPETRRVLEALPLGASIAGGVALAHGAPGDPQRYVRTADEARAEAALLEPDGVLVLGHTHVPAVVGADAGDLTASSVALDPADRFVVNPGAVGQSRSADPRARCAVLDLGSRTVELLAVPYDAAATRAALRARGLPPWSSHRPPARFPGEYRVRRALRSVRRGAARRGPSAG